ncbi:MAG: hypothetical protein EZS28_027025 [Streblomastix strix]|uniref:Calponin-homology (CH) domain-containing protein n=1 Tax=Streblomastix strix TaxID=222440 RepID=A0A5J4V3X9_9EUKA|nr:MAG: hypothetical protein EZS28_027025 [Streblomastix strix]
MSQILDQSSLLRDHSISGYGPFNIYSDQSSAQFGSEISRLRREKQMCQQELERAEDQLLSLRKKVVDLKQKNKLNQHTIEAMDEQRKIRDEINMLRFAQVQDSISNSTLFKQKLEVVSTHLLNEILPNSAQYVFTDSDLTEGRDILSSPDFYKLLTEVIRKIQDGTLTPSQNCPSLSDAFKTAYSPSALEFGLKCLKEYNILMKAQIGRQNTQNQIPIGENGLNEINTKEKTGGIRVSTNNNVKSSLNVQNLLLPGVQAILFVFLLDELAMRDLNRIKAIHKAKLNLQSNKEQNNQQETEQIVSIFAPLTTLSQRKSIFDTQPGNKPLSISTIRPSFLIFPERSHLKKTSEILDAIIGAQFFSGNKTLSKQLFSQLRIQGRYEQTREMEYKYEIKDIKVDLSDGIRLAKLLEELIIQKVERSVQQSSQDNSMNFSCEQWIQSLWGNIQIPQEQKKIQFTTGYQNRFTNELSRNDNKQTRDQTPQSSKLILSAISSSDPAFDQSTITIEDEARLDNASLRNVRHIFKFIEEQLPVLELKLAQLVQQESTSSQEDISNKIDRINLYWIKAEDIVGRMKKKTIALIGLMKLKLIQMKERLKTRN